MSLLRETFERGKFAITAEMAPPKGTDLITFDQNVQN